MFYALKLLEHALLVVALISMPLGLIFLKQPRLCRLFGVVCLLALGGWVEVSVLRNVIHLGAMEFSPTDTWLSYSDRPFEFWLSIFFHSLLGFVAIWFAVRVMRRPLDQLPKANPLWPNTPVTRFAAWFMLALVLTGIAKEAFSFSLSRRPNPAVEGTLRDKAAHRPSP